MVKPPQNDKVSGVLNRSDTPGKHSCSFEEEAPRARHVYERIGTESYAWEIRQEGNDCSCREVQVKRGNTRGVFDCVRKHDTWDPSCGGPGQAGSYLPPMLIQDYAFVALRYRDTCFTDFPVFFHQQAQHTLPDLKNGVQGR